MAETHFTPGPWEASERGDYCDFDGESRVVIGDDRRVCIVQHSGDEEAEANTHLIASAPDLYAALEEACTSLMIVSEQALDASKTDARWLGVYEKLAPHIAAGRAALSKARGETNE